MIYDYPVNTPLPLKKLLIKRSLYKQSRKCERSWLRNSIRILEEETPGKLKCLSNFVYKLKEKTNSKLKGAEISDLAIDSKTGFMGFNINFYRKEPDFLDEQDKEKWYSHLMEVAKNEFEMDYVNEVSDLYQRSIFLSADEPGGSYKKGMSLIALFTRKNLRDMVKKGFKQTKNYINWYLEEIKKHDELIKNNLN